MDELVHILNAIHKDLFAIFIVLICILCFKDCHGSVREIVNELEHISRIIKNK